MTATTDPASLDRLHDVTGPPPVPFWPPAVGWYWLGGGLALLALWEGLRALARWQRNRYRREALSEWRRQDARLSSAEARVAALSEMAGLLKRTALSGFARERVASATGKSWRAILNRTGATPEFSSPAGELLERAAYGLLETPPTEADARRSAALVRTWIRRHRPRFPEASRP